MTLQHHGRDFAGDATWPVTFTLNGQETTISVDPSWTLFEVLRDQLDLIGTKGACLEGECGSCSVLIDGVSQNACLTMGAQIDGRTVVTVEGLADGDALAPIQQAFVDCGAVQCGYCTPGLVVTAHAMLEKGEALDEEAVRRGLEGNICRCTGYMKIIQAVQTACQSKACSQEVAK